MTDTGSLSGSASCSADLSVLDFVHNPLPARVVFGPGARGRIAEETARLGMSRVLLIGGADPLRAAADEVARALGGALAGRITDIVQHVPAAAADAAAHTAAETRADGIVAVGGGSATGLAKAVALVTGLPIIAVPTTYAGSEMTDIWGRTEGRRKITGRSPRVRPQVVLYDVSLTLAMPAQLTAVTGLNALAHCIEAAYDVSLSPVVRLLAVEGTRAIAAALPAAVRNGADVTARSQALYGAWLAGTALGSAQMGVHHGLCHILGGAFGLPHAETHAVVLPHAVAFNQAATGDALTPIARALGTEQSGIAAALWDLARRVGAPSSLAELGLTRDDANLVASSLAAQVHTNPRTVEPDSARELVLACYRGERPAPAVM